MFTTVLGCAAFAVTVKATSSAILNSVKKDQEQNAKLCRMARANCKNPRHDACPPVYEH